MNGMNYEKETLEFYNQIVNDFASRTVSADMSEEQGRFTACLPDGALILDFGCGPGRDTKAFLDAGYRVEAADGSEEMCRAASAFTGIPVKRMLFEELDAESRYDGIWACASLLHLPAEKLPEVLRKIERALKPGGVLYASFRCGDFEGMLNGRYFSYYTEETLREAFGAVPGLRIFELWMAEDHLPEKRELQWICVLARRKALHILRF